MIGVFRKGKNTGKRVPLAAKAKAMVSKIPLNPVQRSQVKKLVQLPDELKQYVQGANGIGYFNGAGIVSQALCTIAQGFGDNQRNGDTIKLTSIRLRMGAVNATGAAANVSIFNRLVIFQYNQSNSVTVPNPATMFLTGAGAGTVNTYSSTNRDFTSTYHILYDKTFRTVGAVGASTSVADNYSHYMSFYVPLQKAKKKIQYIAGGANCLNQIYFFMMSDLPAVATNPSISWDCTVRFTDA